MDKGTMVELKAAIRSLVLSSGDIMTIQQLERDYKSFMGKLIPFKSLGFDSTERMLHSLPDVVKIKGSGQHALVQHVPSENSEHIRVMVRNQKKKSNPRQTIRRRIKQSSESSTDWMPNVQEEPLQYAQYHNESPRSISSLQSTDTSNSYDSDIRCCMKASTGSQLKRFNLKPNSSDFDCDENIDQLSKSVEPSKSKYIPPEENTLNFGPRTYAVQQSKVFIDAIPNYAVTDLIAQMDDILNVYDQEVITPKVLNIPQCKLYEELEKGSVITVYISEIVGPMKFFIHKDEENHELVLLTDQMQKAYSSTSTNRVGLVEPHLRPGVICAAKRNKHWYRAQVISYPKHTNSFSKARVLFIDFGRVDFVPIKHLSALLPTFFNVPVQAARARLSGIEPNLFMHSSKAAEYFEALACKRCLFAYVTDIDFNTPGLELILLDNNVKPKSNINKVLNSTLQLMHSNLLCSL